MANMKFTESHEWACLDQDTGEVTIGITAFAVEHLGDIVFLELPESNASISKGKSFGTIESVKSASDIYSPVTGEIVAINSELCDNLEWLESPYEKAWMIRIKAKNPSELDALMDEAAYQDYLKTQE